MESPAPIHHEGEHLGPYVLERLLGRGAAAEVWQVVETGDLGFRKRQALKLLRPPPGEMEAQKKALINEARVCGHLKHPGVVDVYRVGEQAGEIFVAMEFVDGPDLNTFLEGLRRQQIKIPVSVCLEMALEIVEALHHAHTARGDDGHALQIIHRDLKPSNILVDRRGVLKVTDWGLVKSTLNLESTTRGVVKGTPGYIAPEVWGGTREFRPSVDLFAVGAMLYEFVVGERLFQGRNLARIAEQVARRKPEEEAARAAERCPQLVPVLTRLLQRVPGARQQTAEELSVELRAIRDGLPERERLKDFLREIGHLVELLAPAVTGTGRVRAEADLEVATPHPGPARLDRGPVSDTRSVPRGAPISEIPAAAELPEDPDEAEPATDPNMRAVPPLRGRPAFESPKTVALDPNDLPADASSSFVGGRPAQLKARVNDGVGATRVMESRAELSGPMDLPPAPARVPSGATRLPAPARSAPSPAPAPGPAPTPELPDDAADTLPPDGPGALKVQVKRAAATGDGTRKRRKKRKPGTGPAGSTGGANRSVVGPAPGRKAGPSMGALVIAILGGALLVIGVLVVVLR